MDKVVHIDVGVTQTEARMTRTSPSIIRLCGASEGETIHDDELAIRQFGSWPAECNCGDCIQVARIMNREDCSSDKALKLYKKMNQRGPE